MTVTLSKSLGAQGGAVLGPARVIDHLVNAARTFIFDTGLAPAAAAALAALRLLGRQPERAARARAVAAELHARLTAAGLDAVRPDAAVVSVRASSRRGPCGGRPTAGRPACPWAASALLRCPTASHGSG
ncbi:8-amino-7-oxononanoate synthase [Streptomyces tendae]